MSTNQNAQYRIVELPAFNVVGLQKRVNNSDIAKIGDLWQQVYKDEMLKKIKNKKHEHQLLGMYSGYELEVSGDYDLTICTEVDKVEDIDGDLITFEVPKQKYAVYTAQGSFPTCLMEAWQKIWEDKSIERVFTYDFEVYNQNFGKLSNAQIEIFIAIK